MKWKRGEVTWSDALSSKTQSGVVSGPFGVVKGSPAWNVIHLPTEKRLLFMFKTQRDGKVFVERLVDMSPGGANFWKFAGSPPAGAARIFQDALKHARGKPDVGFSG